MLRQPDTISNLVVSSFYNIAMNVLSKAAHGHSKPFKPSVKIGGLDKAMSYGDAVWLCSTNLFYAAFIPHWLLELRFWSQKTRTIGSAKRQLTGLTQELLTAERQLAMSPGHETQNNLMSMLIRMTDSAKNKDENSTQYLTDEEISGNLFAFTAAGFDTTANTMAYALTLLGAYPEWQTWVQEEIDFVWKSVNEDDEEDLKYSTIAPRLTRILAVMVCLLKPFII